MPDKLSHDTDFDYSVKYIGPLSRFEKKEEQKIYDLLILLSGPEPQRTIFEKKILSQSKDFPKNTIFIKGNIENKQTLEVVNNLTVYNYLVSNELEKFLNQSKFVLARSGYTTIMDLIVLHKKAFLIPTPGQSEQKYLAKKLHADKIFQSCSQNQFNVSKLTENNLVEEKAFDTNKTNWKTIFQVFDIKKTASK